MAKQDDSDQKLAGTDTKPDTQVAHTNADKAEWVALMCLIAKRDRDLYRKLRAEAWESVVRFGMRSTKTN